MRSPGRESFVMAMRSMEGKGGSERHASIDGGGLEGFQNIGGSGTGSPGSIDGGIDGFKNYGE
jgi:hypothetical protein